DSQSILLKAIGLVLQVSIREFRHKTFDSIALVVVKSHITNPFWSGGYNKPPERTLSKTIINRKILSSVFVFSRSHAFDVDEQVMQSSRSRKSGIVCRIKQSGLLLLKQTFSMLDTDVLYKLFGSGACPLGKQTLKMKRTQMHDRGYVL